MSMTPTLGERFTFGTPILPDDDPLIHSVPRPATALVGRILIATIFFVAGIMKLIDTPGTAAYMTAAGIPYAETLAIAAGFIEVFGAIMIATGFLTRVGATALFLYLIPVSLLFHPFWMFEGAARAGQMLNFLKNLAVIGGLLLLVARGAGAYSIDGNLRRPQEA